MPVCRSKKKKFVFPGRKEPCPPPQSAPDTAPKENNVRKRKNFTKLEKLEGHFWEKKPKPLDSTATTTPPPDATAASATPPDAEVLHTSFKNRQSKEYDDAHEGNVLIDFPSMKKGVEEYLCCKKCVEREELN